jgi:glycosyltransferase involved in cell wall biosynthesis
MGWGIFLLQKHEIHQKIKEEKNNQKVLGLNKYDPITHQIYPVKEQKKFVVIIPSYNNELYYEKNLSSVFSQKYDNYRVIYVDDCSKDQTYEKVKKYIEDNHQQQRVTLIRNTKNAGALKNLYESIHSCHDDEIIVTLDGDDWLASPQVLNILNQYYANPNIWMTFGDFIEYPSGMKSSYCDFKVGELKNKTFRQVAWRTSHLRTFYAALFKRIPLKDFLYEGKLYKMTWDMAFMYPMIEMAHNHFAFIPNILYIYNRENVLNDDKVNLAMQLHLEKVIRSLSPYKKIETLNFQRESNDKADIVIFSFDRPMQLFACLESIQKYIKNLDHISVIYRITSDQYEHSYTLLKAAFPQVEFLQQRVEPINDFKALVQKACFDPNHLSKHILFSTDDIIVKDEVDIARCIESLDKTKAFGFYLRLGLNINNCYALSSKGSVQKYFELNSSLVAWQFKYGEGDWNYPNTVDMTLYRKKDIQEALAKMEYSNPNELEGNWAAKYADFDGVGLCYSVSKIVNLPINLVNSVVQNRHGSQWTKEKLEDLFEKGYKIDILPFHQIVNNAPHAEYDLNFVKR